MIALFAGGGISGHLTHVAADSTNLEDEPVLVIGFDETLDPLCISADGTTELRQDYMELVLDWRFEKGKWKTLEEIEDSKGETGEEVPDAGSAQDGSAD